MSLPATVDGMDTLQVSEHRRRFVRAGGLGGGVAAFASSGCASVQWFDQAPHRLSANNYAPPLYRLNPPAGYRGAGWLLGAIHAGRTDLFPLPEAVIRRFHAADALAVEMDITQRRDHLHAAFKRHALLPDDQQLEDHLDPHTIKWLKKRFNLSPARWLALRRLQPWALTRALHGTDRPSRSEPAQSTEQAFLALARKLSKPVYELEQPEEQVRALAGGSIAWQAKLLDFRVTERQFWDNRLDKLIHAWRAGNESKLLAIKVAAFGNDRLRAPLRQRMFADRDQQMARRLMELMREPRGIFTTVGAFHLVGKASLPDQLRRLGVRVERVVYRNNVSA